MIRHVVAWNLVASSPTQRDADAAGIAARLEALVGVVPGLLRLEVRRDLGNSTANHDVLLDADYEDHAALAGYQTHPAHVEAAAFVRSVTRDRACVDWEA